MKASDLASLVLLAALWGASFLLTRFAVPDFGAIALTALRVGTAALFLLPLLIARGQVPVLRRHWRAIGLLGVIVSALPFTLFSYALLSITAGLGSILNAVTPMFAAIVAFAWFRDALAPSRVVGLGVGLLGVFVLVWDGATFKPGGSGLAVLAVLAATACYGIGANYTRRWLGGVHPLAIATGSQLAAALALLPSLFWSWPQHAPGAGAWASVIALGVACTGIAFVIFFRLAASIGAARATTVTYLIPVFGMLWGALFLHEPISARMLGGCAVILLGVALTTGLLSPGGLARAALALQRTR